MTKGFNEKTFSHEINNGQAYHIDCYTTSTRNGFCHHAKTYIDGVEYKTRVSYINRTWECFRYQVVIEQLIRKLPEHLREGFKTMFVDFEEAKAKGECEKFINDFKTTHDSLSPEMKEWFANHTPTFENEEQAKTVLNVMRFASIFETLMK